MKTCFIIGSGPSLRHLSDEQLFHIREHTILGLNFSFLFKALISTHHYLGYEPSSMNSIKDVMTEERRTTLGNTVWFLPWRSILRGYHPIITPSVFPVKARISIIRLQPRLELNRDGNFTAQGFRQSLRYRGVMGTGLYLAEKLGADKIVLLGVDLHTTAHFFDEYPEMRADRAAYNEKMGSGYFEGQRPRGNLHRTMSEYYEAVNRLYFKPKNIELLSGGGNTMGALPEYDWSNEIA